MGFVFLSPMRWDLEKEKCAEKTGFEEELEKNPSKFREKNKFLQLPIQIPMSVFLE